MKIVAQSLIYAVHEFETQWRHQRLTFFAPIMEHAFEAPALEELSIAKLHPPENIHGNKLPNDPL
jgi:hypothetical protein